MNLASELPGRGHARAITQIKLGPVADREDQMYRNCSTPDKPGQATTYSRIGFDLGADDPAGTPAARRAPRLPG